MPKKSESQNENKGRSIMQGRGQKASREEGSNNISDNRQQMREERSDKVNDNRQQLRDERSGNVSDYRQQIREKKLVEGNKKNGCFPRLFMLFLPFIAVGTYMFLRS
jgi:hypothetical protein